MSPTSSASAQLSDAARARDPRRRRWMFTLGVFGTLGLIGLTFVFAWIRSTNLGLVQLANREGVFDIRIDRPMTYWQREGFTRLVPPVRLPSSTAEREQIEIWIKIPADAAFSTELVEDQGRHALRMPPGTVVDRVEFAGLDRKRFVADVRGTRFGDDGRERFRVLRPTRPGPAGKLRGFEWDRGSAEQQREVTDALVEFVASTRPFVAMDASARESSMQRLRSINACASCHQATRPANRRLGEHGRANRPTDASGLYTPVTVLEDTAPIETYRPRDPNIGDPHVSVRCGDQPARRRGATGASPGDHYECPGRQVPLATYDLTTALAANAPRARALCDSRLYLYERLDARGREVFEAAVRPCRGP